MLLLPDVLIKFYFGWRNKIQHTNFTVNTVTTEMVQRIKKRRLFCILLVLEECDYYLVRHYFWNGIMTHMHRCASRVIRGLDIPPWAIEKWLLSWEKFRVLVRFHGLKIETRKSKITPLPWFSTLHISAHM